MEIWMLGNLINFGTTEAPYLGRKRVLREVPTAIPLPPEWEKSAHQAKICVCAQILYSDLYKDKTFDSFFKQIAIEAKIEAFNCFPAGKESNVEWEDRIRKVIMLPQIVPKKRSESVTYALVRLTAEGFDDVKKLWDEKAFNLPEHTKRLESLGGGYIDLNRRESRYVQFSQTFPYVSDSSLRSLPRARL